MIFGHVNDLESAFGWLPRPLKTAVEHLAKTDFLALPAGNYDLEGKDIYVQVIDMSTKPFAETRAEVHRQYIDVQFLARGREKIGVAHREADIAELWALRERFAMNKACAVVKHDYATQHPRKYLGTPLETGNESYPRKNWSSVILWNCGHYANRILTPELVAEASGKQVHRFEWLRDEQIDDLPGEWNHLVGEYPEKESKLYHFTLGVPGFERYARDEGAVLWHEARERMNHLVGV